MTEGIWAVAELIFGACSGIGTAGLAVTGFHHYRMKAAKTEIKTEHEETPPESSEENKTSEDN